jgi:hypothetical protein
MSNDESLRTLVRAAAAEAPTFEPRLDEVRGRARRRRARRTVTIALACSILVLGVAVPLALLSGLGESGVPQNSSRPNPSTSQVGPGPRGTLSIRARVQAQRGAVDVEAGYGSLWVSGGTTLTRIDPSSARVIAQIPLPGAEDFSRIAIGAGYVWVSADHGIAYRVDPATGIAVPIRTKLSVIQPIAVGGGYLWVAGEAQNIGPGLTGPYLERSDVTNLAPRQDSASGGPVDAMPVGNSPSSALFAAGHLWLTTDQGVQRFNASMFSGPTGPDEITVPGTASAEHLTYGAGSIWTTGSDQVIRIDPSTARVVDRIPLARAGGVSFCRDTLWVMVLPRTPSQTVFEPARGHPGSVVRIDPRTDRLFGKSLKVPGVQPIGIAGLANSGWSADYTDGVVAEVAAR